MMVQAIGSYMADIREQRRRLHEWHSFKNPLENFWQQVAAQATSPTHAHFPPWAVAMPKDFDAIIAQYYHYTDSAEARLKKVATRGHLVDVTGTALGDDLLAVTDPRHTPGSQANKHRIRANLARYDFIERCGYKVEIHVEKLTVPEFQIADALLKVSDLSDLFVGMIYHPVVLLAFEDPQAAMLYRLSL